MPVEKVTRPMIRLMIESLSTDPRNSPRHLVFGNRRTREGLIRRGLAYRPGTYTEYEGRHGRVKEYHVELTGAALTMIREEAGRSEEWLLGGVPTIGYGYGLALLLLAGGRRYTVRTSTRVAPGGEKRLLSFEQARYEVQRFIERGARYEAHGDGSVWVRLDSGVLSVRVFEPVTEDEGRALLEGRAVELVGDVALWDMRVGVLRADARLMGRYGAANVRAAIVNGAEEGQRAEVMTSGEIRVGYSWFAPVVV